MKQITTLLILVTVLLTTGLASCSQQITGGENAPADLGQLTCQVSDGGYQQWSDPQSTAKKLSGQLELGSRETDYKTNFTAGDQIGLFAVKDGQIQTGYDNLGLTAQGSETSITWTTSSGEPVVPVHGATYYAYYPYQKTLMGALNASASDAKTFFADMINKWTPATDQSTQSLYTACDLMVAKGTEQSASGKKIIHLTMTHQMALAVISLKTDKNTSRTTYHFTNTKPSVPDYTIPVSVGGSITPRFDGGIKPYETKIDGNTVYRYLVNPATAGTTTLSGGFVGNDIYSWFFSLKELTSGSYRTFLLQDDNVPVIVSWTLQSGDYFLKDGSLANQATDENKPNIIGIVFWVGNPAKDDKLMLKDHPGCTHGLVVNLTEAGTGKDQQNTWGPLHSNWHNWAHDKGYQPSNSVAELPPHPILNQQLGYTTTQAVKAYENDPQTSGSEKSFPAVDDAFIYGKSEATKQYAAPGSTTGWYLPSEKELAILCGGTKAATNDIADDFGTTNWDAINKSLAKLDQGAYDPIQSIAYWSATEYNAGNAWPVIFALGGTSSASFKADGYLVRCVLGF